MKSVWMRERKTEMRLAELRLAEEKEERRLQRELADEKARLVDAKDGR